MKQTFIVLACFVMAFASHVALTGAPSVGPAGDAGAQDPTGFPRAAGLVRRSYSARETAARTEQIATYHTPAALAETSSRYQELAQTDGWNRGASSDSGSGFNLVRIIDWTKSGKEAEVRFYAVKSGGTDLWVRLFTYKAGPAGKPVMTAAVPVASAAQAKASNAAAVSAQTGATKLGPAPANITIVAQNVLDHTITWSSPPCTRYRAMRQDASGWALLGQSQVQVGAVEHALVKPNTTYRVLVDYPDGSEGTADYVWAHPPQFQATLSPAQGNEATPIKITHNLGPQWWNVRLVPPAGVGIGPAGIRVEYWDATSATVHLQNMNPIGEFDGSIELSPPAGMPGDAIRLPFRWVPQYVTQVINLEDTNLNSGYSGTLPDYHQHRIASQDSRLSGPGPQLNPGYVEYRFPFVLGGKGDDEFFTQELMDPAWTVQSVEIASKTWLGKGEARIVDSRVGTNSPYVKVHWWADLQSDLTYSLKITIKGPAGGQPLKYKVLPAR